MTPEKLAGFDELVRKFAEALDAHSVGIEWHGRPYSLDRNITIQTRKTLKGTVQEFFLNYAPVAEKKFSATVVPGAFLSDVYPTFENAENAIAFLAETLEKNK